MHLNEFVESPVTLLADATVGDQVGLLTTASEPALCAVAGTIAATLAVGTAVVADDAGIAALTAAAAAGVAAAGATVATHGNTGAASIGNPDMGGAVSNS
ncbi:MAG TPA: hypothetical protein VJT49_12520 [Amycolatopsis sp.]|uniref:hypothetical protein n=1 Tax=Amycolatopsis sp. TaxID=37632 RepID=UPI002B4954B6|nr:hypothetical protein [Amycolatopsis sp.]HKS45912.1 hypothetical protein [Amycolatopsis sp.]